MYKDLLCLYARTYAIILAHLRDRPGESIMWHCTAGKDRAGSLAILLLNLAGAGRDLIGFDYSLSRIGVEGDREVLQRGIEKWLGEDVGVRFVCLFVSSDYFT